MKKVYCRNCEHIWNTQHKITTNFVCIHKSNIEKKVIKEDWYRVQYEYNYLKSPMESNKNNDCENYKGE